MKMAGKGKKGKQNKGKGKGKGKGKRGAPMIRIAGPRITPAGLGFAHCSLDAFAGGSAQGVPDGFSGNTIVVEDRMSVPITIANGENSSMVIMVIPALGPTLWYGHVATTVDKSLSDVSAWTNVQGIKLAKDWATFASAFRTMALQMRITDLSPTLIRGGIGWAAAQDSFAGVPFVAAHDAASTQDRIKTIDNTPIDMTRMLRGMECGVWSLPTATRLRARPRGAGNYPWTSCIEPSLVTFGEDSHWAEASKTLINSDKGRIAGLDDHFGQIIAVLRPPHSGTAGTTYNVLVEVMHCVEVQPRMYDNVARAVSHPAPDEDDTAIKLARQGTKEAPIIEPEASVTRTAGRWLARKLREKAIEAGVAMVSQYGGPAASALGAYGAGRLNRAISNIGRKQPLAIEYPGQGVSW